MEQCEGFLYYLPNTTHKLPSSFSSVKILSSLRLASFANWMHCTLETNPPTPITVPSETLFDKSSPAPTRLIRKEAVVALSAVLKLQRAWRKRSLVMLSSIVERESGVSLLLMAKAEGINFTLLMLKPNA